MVLVSCNGEKREVDMGGDRSVRALLTAIQGQWQHESGFRLKQQGRWLQKGGNFDREKHVTAVKQATKDDQAKRRAARGATKGG
eukprot:13526733-Alexandrium_andersonii.AAC.1